MVIAMKPGRADDGVDAGPRRRWAPTLELAGAATATGLLLLAACWLGVVARDRRIDAHMA